MTMTVESETPTHTSVSALGDAGKCLKLYELKRVEKLEGPPAYYFAGGRAVHAATEAYDRQLFTMSGR